MLLKPRLVYESSNGTREEFVLSLVDTTIGRDSPADIIMLHSEVSRRHAMVRYADQAYTIVDLGSTNGTMLNGNVVGTKPISLRSGDEIVLGGIAKLHFHDIVDSNSSNSINANRSEGIWIEAETQSVWIDSELVAPPLGDSQLELLQLLYNASGKFVSREEIIANIWSSYHPTEVSADAVDRFIERLRNRLLKVRPEVDYLELSNDLGLRLIVPEGTYP